MTMSCGKWLVFPFGRHDSAYRRRVAQQQVHPVARVESGSARSRPGSATDRQPGDDRMKVFPSTEGICRQPAKLATQLTST